MTVRGTIRGNTIHIVDRLPFRDGEQVQVDVELVAQPSAEPGTAQALREGLRRLVPIPGEFADELERLIEEGRTYSPTPHFSEDQD
jgi:hypothetical protein